MVGNCYFDDFHFDLYDFLFGAFFEHEFAVSREDSFSKGSFRQITGEYEQVLWIVREVLEVFDGRSAYHHSACGHDDRGACFFDDLFSFFWRAYSFEYWIEEWVLVSVEDVLS